MHRTGIWPSQGQGLRTTSSDRSGLRIIIVQVRPVHHEDKGHNLSFRLWKINTFLPPVVTDNTTSGPSSSLKCFASLTFNAGFPILNNVVFHHSGFHLMPAVKVDSFKGWVSAEASQYNMNHFRNHLRFTLFHISETFKESSVIFTPCMQISEKNGL